MANVMSSIVKSNQQAMQWLSLSLPLFSKTTRVDLTCFCKCFFFFLRKKYATLLVFTSLKKKSCLDICGEFLFLKFVLLTASFWHYTRGMLATGCFRYAKLCAKMSVPSMFLQCDLIILNIHALWQTLVSSRLCILLEEWHVWKVL